MNTTVLDKCLKTFLDAYLDEQATYDLLLGPESNFLFTILEEFRMELGLNILSKVSHQEKIDLVKFYISEISRAKSNGAMYVLIDINLLANDDENHSYADATRLTRQVDGLLRSFYKLLLERIHSQCKIYQLPFFRIRDELHFSLAGFDIDLISDLEEKKTQKPKQISIASKILKKKNSEGDQEFKDILLEIRNAENLFCEKMPMEMVIDHFKIFLQHENHLGIPFLTPDQFISFLKKGFLKDKNEEKQIMNCPRGTNGLVIKQFYLFYDKAIAGFYSDNKQEVFRNLIFDCFSNWGESAIKSSFRKDLPKKKL